MKTASRLIATTLAIAGAFTLAVSTASAGRANFYYHVAYYGDASYTVQSGDYSQYCLNNTTIMTPYYGGPTSEFIGHEILGVCPGEGDW